MELLHKGRRVASHARSRRRARTSSHHEVVAFLSDACPTRHRIPGRVDAAARSNGWASKAAWTFHCGAGQAHPGRALCIRKKQSPSPTMTGPDFQKLYEELRLGASLGSPHALAVRMEAKRRRGIQERC